jgi:hypothetical protein
MASRVVSEKTGKYWLPHSHGQFQVIFGALYELYLDKNKVPLVCANLLPKLKDYLHHCWPERYEKPDGVGLDFFDFSQYPKREKIEVLRATECLLQDFERDRLDPDLRWNEERKGDFISALREFIGLMREDIAAG